MHQKKSISVTVGDHELTFETGQLARQADGAVLVKLGETFVFASACASKEPMEGVDFLPMRVDYQRKFSSAGKTLGGFIKREGRPTEKEILISRLIDRPIRPMFEDGYYCDTQLLAYVLSYDNVNSPEPLAICAASAALVISDIPLIKPIAAVRVGLLDSKFIVNPTSEQQEKSDLDLMIAGTEDAVLMIEGYCDFLTEEQVVEAIEAGHAAIKKICQTLSDWQKEVGKPKNRDRLRPATPQALHDAVEKLIGDKLGAALTLVDKHARGVAIAELKNIVHTELLPEGEEPKFNPLDVAGAFKKAQSTYLRNLVLEKNARCDGRKTDEIRPIAVEAAPLPRTHGSALFTRGETQSLAVCTLGGESMGQRYEDLNGEGTRRFYLQYFFPPFSVGECGRMGPASRREVGHGKLAERALNYSVPTMEKFPYSIRVESNIMECNGSSSMASVCGGCLAMMNAGVPLKRPVAGIAMGLVLEGNKHAILSDILGIEDALGDMDFKITGDADGITAFQMDIKVEGITVDIMRQALAQAKAGRVHILEKMLAVVPTHSEIAAHAPRIESIQVKPSQIGMIIGPGGKQIREIEAFGVKLDITDDGVVSIVAADGDAMAKARGMVEAIVAEVEEGKTYEGTVTGIKEFGMFVEVLPGKEGMCHISEYDHARINDLNDHVKMGDKVTVKCTEINERGQVRLSRKALLEGGPTGSDKENQRPRENRPPRQNRRPTRAN